MNYRILSITVFSERKEGYEAEKRTEEAEEERRKKSGGEARENDRFFPQGESRYLSPS